LKKIVVVLLVVRQWGTFYLFIAKFFVTQNMYVGGAKELAVLL